MVLMYSEDSIYVSNTQYECIDLFYILFIKYNKIQSRRLKHKTITIKALEKGDVYCRFDEQNISEQENERGGKWNTRIIKRENIGQDLSFGF